jgi:4-hydroxy 2-oxovalerate aldolase
MSDLPAPKILDVTIRDGSNLVNHKISPKNVSDISAKLSGSGIDYMEVSHGCGIGGKMMGFPGLVDDEELMEAAKKSAPDIPLSAFISPNEYSLPLIPALIDFFELGRVGTNVDEVIKAEKIIEKLKKYNKKVALNLVRAHAKDAAFVGQAAKRAEELGAEIVYLVDTFGSFTPKETGEYINAIQSEVKIEIGFHGHNHSGLAVSNALMAWNQGAQWLDASLMGVGRGPGNTNLEILVNVLHQKGFRQEINLHALCQATAEEVYPLFQHPPQIKLRDLVFSKNRIDLMPDDTLDFIASLLHLPLTELGKRLGKIKGEAVQISDDHIKTIIEEEGEDVDQIAKIILGKSADEKCKS